MMSRLALTAILLVACKDKDTRTKAPDLDARCQHLAAACGDQGKHVDKMAAECKDLAKVQVAKDCASRAITLYECYEKELCGKADKVWAVDDLRVLSERQSKCVAERAALGECTGK